MLSHIAHTSHIDSNPQQEKEHPKAHEYGGNKWDEQLLKDVPWEFGGCHLINEEPGHEEDANTKQYHGKMGEHCWVDRAHIPVHGFHCHILCT